VRVEALRDDVRRRREQGIHNRSVAPGTDTEMSVPRGKVDHGGYLGIRVCEPPCGRAI
jgi:hypothetical protein